VFVIFVLCIVLSVCVCVCVCVILCFCVLYSIVLCIVVPLPPCNTHLQLKKNNNIFPTHATFLAHPIFLFMINVIIPCRYESSNYSHFNALYFLTVYFIHI
jgi:hypothetical protein